MRVTSDCFLRGLKIYRPYFFKQLKRIGVNSRYFFTEDDLLSIKQNLPVNTYKTARIVERANDLLLGRIK